MYESFKEVISDINLTLLLVNVRAMLEQAIKQYFTEPPGTAEMLLTEDIKMLLCGNLKISNTMSDHTKALVLL